MHHFRNGFYNSAKKEMALFRASVREQVPFVNSGVVFGKGVPVTLTVKCYMRRPNSDFKGSHISGSLKAVVSMVRPIPPDIDNLAKFVLDALNGLVYYDDSQVVKLVVWKLMDSEGDCSGRTVIKVAQFHDHNLA